MDTNKVWLTGLVISRPILTKSPKTTFASFTLLVQESFKDRAGVNKIHPNIVIVESLGRSAETVAARVVEGQRFGVEGYMRQDERDGHSNVRVRSFSVYPEKSAGAENYRQGLVQALSILAKHGSLGSAVKELEALVSAG
jgi:single-stranded DNA-binding protein